MYIGNNGTTGLHHLLDSLVRSSLRAVQHVGGNRVDVALQPDQFVQVSDDGSGIPALEPLLEVDYEKLPQPHPFDLAPGREWLDHAVVAALSERFEIETHTQGRILRQAFEMGGVAAAPPVRLGPTKENGLAIRFRPDRTIFDCIDFDSDTIRLRLQSLAFLRPDITITFSDDMAGSHESFHHPAGLIDCVNWLDSTADRHPLHSDVLSFDGEIAGTRFEAAFRWNREEEEVLAIFANDVRAVGGTPMTGFYSGLSRSLGRYLRDNISRGATIARGHSRAGLTVVMTIRGNDLSWEGATRSYLSNPELRSALETSVGRRLKEYFQENPDAANAIVRAAAARIDGPAMTEGEWQEADDLRRMLRFLNLHATRRRLVLFLAECVRLQQKRNRGQVLRALDAHADGEIDEFQLLGVETSSQLLRGLLATVSTRSFGAAEAGRVVANLAEEDRDVAPRQAEALRDIFGNPFRPVEPLDPFRTSTVLAIARQMYESRDFAAMPLLADALEEAGCENQDVLTHCLGEHAHVRGCWVIDLILGNDLK